jgi:hypothetical protein
VFWAWFNNGHFKVTNMDRERSRRLGEVEWAGSMSWLRN